MKQVKNSSGHPITGAAYVRVSTDDQLELSPESQLSEILSYAKEHHIFIPQHNIFLEKDGRSGKRAENRPEFQRMIACAKSVPKPFSVILVWKFSRFARNQDESTFYKGMLRKKLAINIISVSEPIMDGMYGRLIEMIIEWQDEFYSYNLGMEVTRGMKENALRGAYQAPPPLGYRYQGKGSIPTIVNGEAEIVKHIFHLFSNTTMECPAIAELLNQKGFLTKHGRPFTARGIVYILKNPYYTGCVRWNRAPHGSAADNPDDEIIIAKGKHQPIVSQELFDHAQKRFKDLEQFKVQGLNGCRHWLSGILICPVCGAALSYHSSGKGGFQCWRYTKGLHKGSAFINETSVINACFTSLSQITGLSRKDLSYFENPDIPQQLKGNVLRSVLTKIEYDKINASFYFYYHP